MNNLIKSHKATALVDNYNQAVKDITQAYDLLYQAKLRLAGVFGQYADQVLPYHANDYNLKSTCKDALKIVKRKAWNSTVKQMGFSRLMSQKRLDQLQEDLNTDNIPDFNLSNIHNIFQSLYTTQEDMFAESVKEVYNWLRPISSYKTNSPYEVQKKVILTRILDNWGFGKKLDYKQEQNIYNLDKIFHALDGNGIPKYPADLVTIIKQTFEDNEDVCNTDYFSAKFYNNGNMHLVFKRLDLVDKFNKIAGKNQMKTSKSDSVQAITRRI